MKAHLSESKLTRSGRAAANRSPGASHAGRRLGPSPSAPILTPPARPPLSGWRDFLEARLGVRELRRRMWHFFPGILALLLTPIPHRDPLPLPVLLPLLAVGIILPGICAVRFYRTMERYPNEASVIPVAGYAVPPLILLLLFRGHVELGLATVGIVAFGDGSATLVGLLCGKRKLPWNRKKSWAGTAAFFFNAASMAALIYWLEATPTVPLSAALLCVAPAAAVAALVESLPTKWNDNALVGISAAVVMVAMQSIVIGWP